MELLIILIVAAIVRAPFILQGTNLFDFDEATFALMAKRILEGELPIFISGHSYSGSFISFLSAPFIALFGNTVFPLKIASLTLFLSFISANYIVLKKIFNGRVAAFASLILIFMTPGMMDVSLRVWGGHASIWIFQALTLYAFYIYFDGPSRFFNGKLLFGLGLLIGCALWISEMFFLFLIPCLLYYFLRFRKPREENVFQWFINFFRLWNFKLSKKIRFLFMGWHAFLLIFFLVHISALFISQTEFMNQYWVEKTYKLFGAIPPFQMKALGKIVLSIGVELILLYGINAHVFSKLLIIRNLGPFLGGLFVGYLPVLFFTIAGGEGLRIFQKSGLLSSGELLTRASQIFTQKLPQFVFGFNDIYYAPETQIQRWGGLFFITIFVLSVLNLVWIYKKDLLAFFVPIKHKIKPSYIWVFVFTVLITLLANLSSTLEAARYLAPIYLSGSVLIAVFLGDILWQKAKVISITILLLLLCHGGYASYQYLQAIPQERQPSYEAMLDYLKENQIQGGEASRTVSHILTYLSGESIIFSTYRQQERYLPHEVYTKSLNNKAYVFETDDSTAEFFRNNTELFSQVTNQKEFGRYVVYLIQTDSNTPDKRYQTSEKRFPISFYLNEL